MGLFSRSAPTPEPALPIPRATRSWPKAVPKAAPVTTSSAAATSAPVVAAAAPPSPPPTTSAAPTKVKPAEPLPEAKPGTSKDASSVVAAFASWKQATSAKTAVVAPVSAPAPENVAAPPASAPAPRAVASARPDSEKREDPVQYVYRAAVKQARGEHDAAIEELTKAIEIDPLCATAWAGRALSLEAKGDLAGARRDYAKSIEIELKREIARLARPL